MTKTLTWQKTYIKTWWKKSIFVNLQGDSQKLSPSQITNSEFVGFWKITNLLQKTHQREYKHLEKSEDQMM